MLSMCLAIKYITLCSLDIYITLMSCYIMFDLVVVLVLVVVSGLELLRLESQLALHSHSCLPAAVSVDTVKCDTQWLNYSIIYEGFVKNNSEPRDFFLRLLEVTFQGAKSISFSAYNDMLQSWIDGQFHAGLLRPPCTLSNQMFRGGHQVFQGEGRPPAPT